MEGLCVWLISRLKNYCLRQVTVFIVWYDWLLCVPLSWPSRESEVFPEVRHTRLPDVIANSFHAGSSSILTHTLNALLPLRGESAEPLLHNIVVRPLSSSQMNYCLLQITDVTVAVMRERVLRERQNARSRAAQCIWRSRHRPVRLCRPPPRQALASARH